VLVAWHLRSGGDSRPRSSSSRSPGGPRIPDAAFPQFSRLHPGSPAEPVLAAWGITTGGKPAFIGLAPGSAESADAWHGFLADLTERGLASPLLGCRFVAQILRLTSSGRGPA
jgi:Transposase, Mutator family